MWRAEEALFRRTSLACAAAGQGFHLAENDEGVFTVVADHPALGFLSTVSGVTPGNLPAAIDALRSVTSADLRPLLLVSNDVSGRRELKAAGVVRASDRLLAIRELPASELPVPRVTATADAAAFATILLAGYQVTGPLAEFVRAEHLRPEVRRLLVLDGQNPIAAAAMSVHGDVAVLGGASTLPGHRRRGAQSSALRHRLYLATEAGCTLAVATARPASTSAANLARAGFRLIRRAAFSAA